MGQKNKKIYTLIFENQVESGTRKIIKEAMSIDKARKVFKDIPENDFSKIINSAPDTTHTTRGVFIDTIGIWMLDQWQKGNLDSSNIFSTKDLLKKYNLISNKNDLKIGNLKSFTPQSLAVKLQELGNLITMGRNESNEDNTKARCRVYSDPEWIIYVPQTHADARILGGDTRWCASSSNPVSWEKYADEEDTLYILVNNNTGNKYQFCFDANEYRDAEDDSVSPGSIGLTKGAKEYFYSIYGKQALLLSFDYIDKDDNNCWIRARKDGKWTFINPETGDLMKEDFWFDDAKPFEYLGDDEYLAVIKLGGNYNIINDGGEYILPQWASYASIVGYDDITAIVRISGKSYFLNDNYELSQPFENIARVPYFNDDLFAVKQDGKYNIFNSTSKSLMYPDGFDIIDISTRPVTVVKDKKFNFLNDEGKLLNHTWFDRINGRAALEADVTIGDKRYILKFKNGDLIEPETNRIISGANTNESRKEKKLTLFEQIVKEAFPDSPKKIKPYTIDPEKVLIVKKFLDNSFERSSVIQPDESGLPKKVRIVIMKSPDGQPFKSMYMEQLEDMLIDRFQNMFLDHTERQKFMHAVLSDWYDNKIGLFGNLSVNSLI